METQREKEDQIKETKEGGFEGIFFAVGPWIAVEVSEPLL